jgi:tetratricopeptide (TPR) repeat protein
MVGRETELARLTGFVAGLDEGFSPGIISLWSPAGAGKSRLVYEVSLLRSDLHWLEVSADEVSRERSDPFLSFVSRWFCQDPSAPRDLNSERFGEAWEGLNRNLELLTASGCREPGPGTIRRVEPVLRSILGIETAPGLYEELDPRSRSEQWHLAVTALIDGIAATGPTVLVLDGVQWFSGEAGCILDGFLCRTLPATLAVITMGRPGAAGRPAGGGWVSRANHMDLEGLSRESIPGFFREFCGSSPSPRLAGLAWEIAGGTPLFIEQLAGFLEDEGCLGDDPRSEGLLGGPDGGVLDLAGLFSARLERRSPALLEAAEAASVLGREFNCGVLGLMIGGGITPGVLEEGSSMGIWAPSDRQGAYLFSHILFRDHIYSRLDPDRAARLHSRAAAAIEELHGRRRENLRDLASHWELSGDRVRAASCLTEAAGYAEAAYGNTDATDIYRRLRCLVDGPQRHTADLALARALDRSGSWTEAVDLLRSILPALSSSADPSCLLTCAEARLLLGDILCRRGSYEEAEDEVLAAGSLFGRAGERGRETAARAIQGRILRHLGRNASAVSMLEECTAAARKEGDPDLLCSVLGILGALKLQTGEPDASRELFREKIDIARMHGLRRREASALINLLNLHRNSGDIEEASRCYRRLLAVSEETCDVNAVGIASNSMGSILVSRRDYPGALECFRSYLDVSRRKNSPHGIATATCNMGVAFMLKGEQARAIECFMRVIDLSTGMMNRQNTAVAYANMGRLFGEMGRFECAIDCAETLMELSRGTGFRSGVASAWMIMACGFHGLGDFPAALGHIEMSLSLTREIMEWRKLPTRLLRRAMILNDAGQDAVGAFREALDASVRYDQPDSAFTARLYLVVLSAGGGTNAPESLEAMVREAETPEQEASACYHSWAETRNRDHGTRALGIYRDILRDRVLEMARARVEELERELRGNLH